MYWIFHSISKFENFFLSIFRLRNNNKSCWGCPCDKLWFWQFSFYTSTFRHTPDFQFFKKGPKGHFRGRFGLWHINPKILYAKSCLLGGQISAVSLTVLKLLKIFWDFKSLLTPSWSDLIQVGVSKLSKSQKIFNNFKTVRDTAKIWPPSRQLFALSIFGFICQRPNRPLKWPFGPFLKNWKSGVCLKVLV